MVHVTDRLLGVSPEQAAVTVLGLAGRSALGLVLHDIPQPAEGHAWYARRRAAYAQMARVARVVVVASRHEATALRTCLDESGPGAVGARIVVIPLPIQPRSSSVAPTESTALSGPPTLGVLGYLYPGKGVEDVIGAAVRLRAESGRVVAVTCLGAAAEGHAEYVGRLTRLAAVTGVALSISGYLPQAQLTRRLHSVTVPVAAHRHVSASGSIATWLEAGRRPVAVPGGYVRELAQRHPGALAVSEDLVAGIVAALDDPAGTWLADDVLLGPSVAAAAAQHADLLEALAGCSGGTSARPGTRGRVLVEPSR